MKWLKQNIALVYFLIIFIINIFFTTLPLLNTLHYEVSFINAILLSFLSGLLTLSFLKEGIGGIKIFPNRIYLRKIISFLIIPFVISFISTIFCQQCPISDGIYFYLVITFPSVIIGSIIALLAYFVSAKYKYPLFVIFWLFLTLGFLPELYFNPQIYFYNPIFAYFPGVMYDINIEITKELILYRIFNVLFSIGVWFLLIETIDRKRSSKFVVITIVMMFYLTFSFYKVELDLATDTSKIESELTTKIETEHFEISLPPNISEREIELVKINHEFYYNELKKLLGTEPTQKIKSFLFESGAQKKRLFGANNADVAKLWMNQIYLNYNNYDNSLKHEIAHIFSAEFANGFFKMPAMYNPGLLEGYAMAIENNYDDFDIDYLAKLAYKNGFKISLKNLFSNFSFFMQTSSITYIYAGSFIKYLVDNYGLEKVNEIYSTLNFEQIINKSLDELEIVYFDYLEKLPIKGSKHKANLYFGRTPLVKKYCARATEKELKNSWEHVNEKHYTIALKKFEKIYEYSNSYNSLLGVVTCNNYLEQYSESVNILENNIKSFQGSAHYYNLEFLLADALIMNDKRESSKVYLDSLIIQNPRTDYRNAATIRKILLAKNDLASFKKQTIPRRDSTIIKYIQEKESRIEIVSKLLNENSTDEILQIYLRMKFTDRENYSSKFNKVIELCSNHKYSSDTYFQLSKFAFNNLDFETSKKYAELALTNAE
ncbi:MAG: hypothetical protein V3V16_00200, partial [Melioribacteraceae bacterium]